MSLLEIKGATKRFGAVQVLNGVDLSIESGTVTGFVGDNGAGKSTLMKIITGIYAIDEGEVRLSGESLNGATPGERRQRGIEMIYQDLALAKQQDVSSNIFLGREPVKWLFGFLPGFVDKARMDIDAKKMIDRLGARIPSIHRPVGMRWQTDASASTSYGIGPEREWSANASARAQYMLADRWYASAGLQHEVRSVRLDGTRTEPAWILRPEANLNYLVEDSWSLGLGYETIQGHGRNGAFFFPNGYVRTSRIIFRAVFKFVIAQSNAYIGIQFC